MSPSSTIEPISYLKSHSAELIKKSKESKRPIVITQNGRATAVIQDMESYQRSQSSLNMLRLVVQGEKEYQAKEFISGNDFRKKMVSKLSSLKENNA